MPYSDDKRAIFLHIPKTGGTTIRRIFNLEHLHDTNPATRPSPQHLTCRLLRDRIGSEKYADYYKFTFIRNPWGRILSSYFWRQGLPKKRPILPFNDFLETARQAVAKDQYYQQDFDDHFIPQSRYTVDVDDIFRFERFAEGIEAVARRLGIAIDSIAPKEPKPHDRYWEYYDNYGRALVSEIYQEEIEEFGYVFGEN